MHYQGGKGGVFQKLINRMPPHEVYIETHLGGGAVMRNKRPAGSNIGIERGSSRGTFYILFVKHYFFAVS